MHVSCFLKFCFCLYFNSKLEKEHIVGWVGREVGGIWEELGVGGNMIQIWKKFKFKYFLKFLT